MILRDVKTEYEVYTQKASDLARQLALAGLAIIWIYKTGTLPVLEIPAPLYTAGFWMVVTLTIDMLQYVISAVLWRWQFRKFESDWHKLDNDVPIRREIAWPSFAFWYLKIGTLAIGYFLILEYLAGRVLAK